VEDKSRQSLGRTAGEPSGVLGPESLAKFKGEKPAKFDGNNDETFNNFDEKSWNHNRDAAAQSNGVERR